MLNTLIEFGTNHSDIINFGLVAAFAVIIFSPIVMFVMDQDK